MALAVGAAMVSQAAQAASPGDLVLGFSDNDFLTPAQDYIVDLGNAGALLSAAQNAPSLTIDLTSGYNFNVGTFDTAFSGDAGALNNVNAGVVGGQQTVGLPKTIWATTLGGSGAPANLGSGTLINSGANVVQGITQYGIIASAQAGSFSANVAVDPYTAGTASGSDDFTDLTGANPLNTLTGGILSEDLYVDVRPASGAGSWAEVGTFNFNLNNTSSDVMTFTASSVPEPSTYELLAGAGLLALVFRRQLSRKNA